MASSIPRVNPLFASPSTSAASATSASLGSSFPTATKIGGYGGVAVAAWLVTAVATGYGVAAADPTTTTSSESTSSSSTAADSTNSTPAEPSGQGTTATPTTGSPTTSASGSTSTGAGTATTGTTTTSGATSSSTEVAPGVTIGSSGGAQNSVPSATAPSIGEPITGTIGAEPEPPSGGPVQSAQPVVSPVPGPQPASAAVNAESNSEHSNVINTVAAPSAITSSTPLATVGDVDVASTTTKPSISVTESSEVPVATAFVASNARSASSAPAVAPAVAPTPQVANPIVGVVGFLNGIVTNLLTPFLAPAPSTPDPLTPMVWAVLGWVRRQLFNEAPTITLKPTEQIGQTVTGDVDGHDAEGDALTYTVTQGPQHGDLTFDQATGKYSYTPDDINYTAAQTDSFIVTVSDGKTNLLSLFGVPHTATKNIDITTLNPMVERVILTSQDLGGVKYPWVPRFSEDGNSIYFTGTRPDYVAGMRKADLYIVNVDGTGLECLSCDIPVTDTSKLFKVVPTYDGTGRVLMQAESGSQNTVIYEPAGYEGNVSARLVGIIPPPSSPGTGEPGGYNFGVAPLQEPRISPDGKYILFNRLGAGANFYFGVISAVGKLDRTTNAAGDPVYKILDARVIGAAGESKNWTPDGKGIAGLFGLYEQGNADNVIVDLATGEVTRLNGNLDYDEDMDLSPNQQWMAVGSLRSMDGLTPLTRIVRPAFLPTYIQGAVYYQYALPLNISNQEWLVRVEDDLQRENGIPLFVQGDGLPGEPDGDDWTARSMPGWNADGTAVTFWEYNIDDPANTEARLVIANLKYTTSVGTIDDRTTPEVWQGFPELRTYTLAPPVLPGVGTYPGAGGGTATLSEVPDPARAGYTLRTVTYTNYVNVDGMILNGAESTSSQANLNTVHYLADIDVTGTQTGYLRGDATINTLQQSITPHMIDENGVARSITSKLGDSVLHLMDPARYQLTLAEQ